MTARPVFFPGFFNKGTKLTPSSFSVAGIPHSSLSVGYISKRLTAWLLFFPVLNFPGADYTSEEVGVVCYLSSNLVEKSFQLP